MTQEKLLSSRIALIGAGSIGGPMAERLLDRGRSLLICDMSQKVREHFSQLGCKVTDDPSDCADCPLIVFIVANDAQLHGAAERLLANLKADARPIVLIMSTVLPQTVAEVARRFSNYGAKVIDAPVSGGSVKARVGELSIMAGGDETIFELVRPLLDDLAVTVFHCGPLGSGETTKILNNLVGVANLFLFSETMKIAQGLGMDLEHLTRVMEASSGRNAGTRDWEARKKLFAWNSSALEASKSVVDVTRKDLHHALTLAQSSATSTPMLEAIVGAHDATAYEAILERWSLLAADDGAGKPNKEKTA